MNPLLKFFKQLACNHRWTPYITVFSGRLFDHQDYNRQIGIYTVQRSICPECNKFKDIYFEE